MPIIYRFGDFELDAKEEILSRDGRIVQINRRAFQVLRLLVERAGETVTKEEFFEAVWENAFVEENNLSVAAAVLRKALNDDPKSPRFIETIPRRGYRFIGEVTVVEEPAATHAQTNEGSFAAPLDTAASPDTSRPTEPGIRNSVSPLVSFRSRKILVGAAACFVLLLLVGAGFKYFSPGSVHVFTPAKPVFESIAVLPFRYAELDDEYLADGITETLTGDLSRVSGLRVVSQQSASKYKGDNIDLAEAATKLNVQSLLTGKFEHRNNEIVLNIELTDTSTKNAIWNGQYFLNANNVLDVQQMLARDIALKLRAPYNAVQTAPKPDQKAYILYLKGKYYWDRREEPQDGGYYDKAVDLYKQAIDIDPSYALPYVGIANAYSQMGINSKYCPKTPGERFDIVNGYVAKALEVDPNLADAYATMGLTDLYLGKRPQWQKAEESFRRALEINPNNARARHWFAEYLALTGHYDESLAEYERAIAVDPLSMAVRGDKCYAYWFAGRSDEAVSCIEAVREMDPSFKKTYWYLFSIYPTANRYADAVEVFRIIENDTPSLKQYAEEDYSAFKNALKANDPAVEFWKVYLHIFTREKSEWQLAFAYAQTGQNDKAFVELDKVIEMGGGIVAYIPSLPLYKPLHNDIRWKVVRTRIGLDQ